MYTLRFLCFASGDPTVVGTPQRQPSFEVVFLDMLNKFAVEEESWLEGDAVHLCSLALYTLYFLKFMFLTPIAPKTFDEDDEVDGEDGAFSSDEKKVVAPECPKLLLPKLVNIVIQLENIFAYADNLDTEVPWIRSIGRKFRASTRGVISSSRGVAATLVFDALDYFSKQMDALNDPSKFAPAAAAGALTDRLFSSCVQVYGTLTEPQ